MASSKRTGDKKNSLLIVESPTKVKAIKKFLGSGYEVAASNGHVRDLPRSQMGVDINNDFEPKYITIRGKGDVLASLRKQVKKAKCVYLATDPDREGEAISWHLISALKLNESDVKIQRVTFNEITKNAVKEAMKHPRDIDMNLVDAQQARRVLDRMVGYSISPLLWSKIKRGLSAGRVQSVALRIIADREEEIDSFIPKEYWTLDVNLKIKGEKKPIVAHYYGTTDEKKEIESKADLDAICASLKGKKFKVTDIKKGERTKKAPLPFTTSTLQQEASKSLNFSTQKTMRVAQQLYEGIDLGKEGTVGLITYLRTDSTRVSDEAVATANKYISENFGDEYLASNTGTKKQDVKIQDAHEAIRPSYIDKHPVTVKEYLSKDQFRLYQLIWRRFMASRMAAAKYETTSVKIDAGEHRFTMAASKTVFDGFLNVYTDEDDQVEKNVISSNLNVDSELVFESFEEDQHFTQPAPHYTEASLVHDLEALGIGRPSTYAPTISTIIARHYITKENKSLYITELGQAVNKMMNDAFPQIVDVNFTSNMESLLDGIADGEVKWKTVIRNFYPDLDQAVADAEKEMEKIQVQDEVTDEICEVCGRNLVIKYGPHGKFLACPGFPECKNTKPYYEKIGVQCPKCGKDIVMKRTRKGRIFYGCIDNPECDFMSWARPVSTKCPKCGSLMVAKSSKLACTNTDCGFVCNKDELEKNN
ncbi:DNA topoisomerase-1 [Butyrivibrio hungatei]|jgi:DNA topoisomerase-1|uniref:DNA topoisomerase 1 n=1 Tax=Butyrivibrio hungatei TaxID=185008 RepID=A0A1G5B348_9FIRM|nr:type I DNA topoisomerase [Butyrivibrio hungatei]MBQ4219318.1 type I DNA topoisomerase [Butyrivibrio sp.]SCX84535.1 DNA topoisomerase-1 [Butyrivibrio hungatei]